MIKFGPMSITLLVCAVQGLIIASLLLRGRINRAANRYLALLLLAFIALITPYIIGYAGFYDRWPWLSFAPLSYTTAFGPLMWLYTRQLTGAAVLRVWRHFIPVGLQFLSQALVFPLPLATKNWWDEFAQASIISPAFEIGALISIAIYGGLAMRRYRVYRAWLRDNRTDVVDFDPRWIRQFLFAILVVAMVWSGFVVADALDPTRDYFDQFWLYVLFSVLVIGLGIEGWRHADIRFPQPDDNLALPDLVAEAAPRDWALAARQWTDVIDRDELWRDPEITLALLARRLGTNSAYLSRAFNVGLGQNFNAVINQRRVAAVQRALANPDESRDLLTIAFEGGFGSKASFNRAFSEFAGKTPSTCRRES